ncbi:hypothetical protein P3T16_004730 [Paraburkholderia sp. GAS42]
MLPLRALRAGGPNKAFCQCSLSGWRDAQDAVQRLEDSQHGKPFYP